MPKVNFAFQSVDATLTSGVIRVWSPRLRPGGTAAITSEPSWVNLVDGRASMVLEPGEVVGKITGNGRTHDMSFTVPSQDEDIDYLDLLGSDFDYAPEVVQAAQAAAREARQWALRAEAGADRVGSAEAVVSARDESVAARDAARSAQAEAEGARGGAESAQGKAEVAESAAASSASAASSSESAASGSASAAAASASAAAGSAGAAKSDAAATAEDRSAVGNARNLVGRMRDEAQAAQAGAEAAQAAAETAQSSTEGAVAGAVEDATSQADGYRKQAQSAAEAASQSKASASSSAQAAQESAEAAAEVVASGVADATTTIKGKLKLAGDLSGTADSPTVPGMSLTAPGANVCLTPPDTGWQYATGTPAGNGAGWSFDGTWVTPPMHVTTAVVRVAWCGATAVEVRGKRRSDSSMVTIGTVPAGDAEEHRSVSLDLDLATYSAVGAAGTWQASDLEAGCDISLTIIPDGKTAITAGEVVGLEQLLNQKAPTLHTHNMGQVTGLDTALGAKLDASKIQVVDVLPATPDSTTIYLVRE